MSLLSNRFTLCALLKCVCLLRLRVGRHALMRRYVEFIALQVNTSPNWSGTHCSSKLKWLKLTFYLFQNKLEEDIMSLLAPLAVST